MFVLLCILEFDYCAIVNLIIVLSLEIEYMINFIF